MGNPAQVVASVPDRRTTDKEKPAPPPPCGDRLASPAGDEDQGGDGKDVAAEGPDTVGVAARSPWSSMTLRM
jgi:hypothetical protein